MGFHYPKPVRPSASPLVGNATPVNLSRRVEVVHDGGGGGRGGHRKMVVAVVVHDGAIYTIMRRRVQSCGGIQR